MFFVQIAFEFSLLSIFTIMKIAHHVYAKIYKNISTMQYIVYFFKKKLYDQRFKVLF